VNATVAFTEEGLVVHPDALRALLLFVCEDPTRTHLRSVFVDDEGHLSATDGHSMIRLCSICPGKHVPKASHAVRWSPEYIREVIKSLPEVKGRGREEQHARLRACLRWDRAEPAHDMPATGDFYRKAEGRKYKTGERAIATHLLLRLAQATDLLVGRDKSARSLGPIQVSEGGPLDAVLYGIPWHEPIRSQSKISWCHGKVPEGLSMADLAPSPTPMYAAEVLIMPLQI
jgi:hypothetical protein